MPQAGAIADFLDFVSRSHVEFNAAAVDLGDDGSAVTRWPTGVAARWRIFTAVPTALSPGSR
ncbi:MAG: hypothetical protein WBV43_10340 [Pseudolabrys sp.]